MYHSVIDTNQSHKRTAPYTISLQNFRAQMEYLVHEQIRTIAIRDLLDASEGGLSSGQNTIALTFDDGYVDNYHLILPILKEFNLIATFFVIAGRVDTPGYLSWAQLHQLLRDGMDIQSHTMNHLALSTLSSHAALYELVESKRRLEQELRKQILFISFPHGSYDERILKLVKRAGYRGALNSDITYFDTNGDYYRIGRIDIRQNHSFMDFVKIVHLEDDIMVRMQKSQRFKRNIQNLLGINNYNRLYRLVYGARS